MLEQIAYQLPRVSEQRQQTYFVVGDLEFLSASAFYTGEPCGAGMLRIKTFSCGSSLHIHEDEEGKITGANIRGKKDKKGTPLSNYEAMMLDILNGKTKII